MIKTVKVKKQLRLDELIKYVRDNGVNSQAFVSDGGRASVYFDSEQNISLGEYTYGELDIERTFTVEVEEEITEDTEFGAYVVVHQNGSVSQSNTHGSIRKIMKTAESVEPKELHAVINGKLQLIWEAE